MTPLYLSALLAVTSLTLLIIRPFLPGWVRKLALGMLAAAFVVAGITYGQH